MNKNRVKMLILLCFISIFFLSQSFTVFAELPSSNYKGFRDNDYENIEEAWDMIDQEYLAQESGQGGVVQGIVKSIRNLFKSDEDFQKFKQRWDALIGNYQTIIEITLTLLTLTLILALIWCIVSISRYAENPEKRKDALKRLMITCILLGLCGATDILYLFGMAVITLAA